MIKNFHPKEAFADRSIPVAGALTITFFLCWTILLSRPTFSQTLSNAIATEDSRKVFSSQSPKWLSAIGKLQVPSTKMVRGYRSAHREDCSASLVSEPGSENADIIITAWHCLEFYKDLSKNITFTLLPASSHPITTQAYRISDGGSMHADWAILRLRSPIKHEGIVPLGIHPGSASERSLVALAGYSSDSGLGRGGKRLTYDPQCEVTLQRETSSTSNCRAFKGASGGAVVQLSDQGEAWLSGVVSQGDSEQLSIFIPVSRFRRAINQHLR